MPEVMASLRAYREKLSRKAEANLPAVTFAPPIVISYAHGPQDQVCIDLSDRLRSMGVDCEIVRA